MRLRLRANRVDWEIMIIFPGKRYLLQHRHDLGTVDSSADHCYTLYYHVFQGLFVTSQSKDSVLRKRPVARHYTQNDVKRIIKK